MFKLKLIGFVLYFRDHKEDYLSIFREFEIKKKTFGNESKGGQKITFRLPVTVHETYRITRGGDFRLASIQIEGSKCIHV